MDKTEFRFPYLKRTLCDVLEEMRHCYQTQNYSSLLSLIEEAQGMGNRMEAGLFMTKDIVELEKEWHNSKKKVKKLHKKLKKLEKKNESKSKG